MILGANAFPRDIDVVVEDGTVPQIVKRYEQHNVQFTRFGGVRLVFGELHVDVWPLKSTWTFRKSLNDASFSNLPKTAFLNIEAIATTIGRTNDEFCIYSAGFFEAVSDRIVEINSYDAASPMICILRALNIMRIFNFRLGPRLARYITENRDLILSKDFEKAQVRRYGDLIFNMSDLHRQCELMRRMLEFNTATNAGWLPINVVAETDHKTKS